MGASFAPSVNDQGQVIARATRTCQIPAGTVEGVVSPAVGDGIYVMLAPLSIGNHTIHFSGEVPDFNFFVDITYHVKVVAGRGH